MLRGHINLLYMITDSRVGADFRILTCTPTQITLVYKQYTSVPSNNAKVLSDWAQFSHPHLLALHRIQTANNAHDSTYGLALEYSVGSLLKFLSSAGFDYHSQEIVNTFHPIVQAVDYLCTHNFQFSPIQLSNIVITEDQQVKFVDEVILNPCGVFPKKDRASVFEELSCLIFDFLVSGTKSKDKVPKSWKNRLTFLRQKFPGEVYNFFRSVLNKSLITAPKTKKISKVQKTEKHREGKQNKLLQLPA